MHRDLVDALDWQQMSGDVDAPSFPTRRKFTASTNRLISRNITSVVSGAELLYSTLNQLLQLKDLNWLVFSGTHLSCSFPFEKSLKKKDMRLTDRGGNYTDSPRNTSSDLWVDPSTSSGLEFLCCETDFWLFSPVLFGQGLRGRRWSSCHH